MEVSIRATSKEALEIINATNKEKPKENDVEALHKLFKEKPQIWQELTDLAESVQNRILSESFSTSFMLKESYKKRLALMRDNLGWSAASEIERILIEQVCLNWLRLNLLESIHFTKTTGNHSSEHGIYWEKRLSGAQRRYLRACESLAKVRKLLAEAELREQQARNRQSKSTFLTNKLLKDLAS